ARALGPQLVRAIRQLHLMHAQTDDPEPDPGEQHAHEQRAHERAAHTRILLATRLLMESCPRPRRVGPEGAFGSSLTAFTCTHGNRSSTRSLALRARGFSRTSSSPGVRGDGSIAANCAAASERNVCLTMRSSPE